MAIQSSVVLHCFAVPANVRKSTNGEWVARASICCIPKVMGQPGSYELVSSFTELLNLPKTLREIRFEIILPNGKVVKAPAKAFNSDLWKWSKSAFVQIEPISSGSKSISSLGSGEDTPHRYDRAGLGSLLLGEAVSLKNTSSHYKGQEYSVGGVYPEMTAASLMDIDGVRSGDSVRRDLNSILDRVVADSDKGYNSSVSTDVESSSLKGKQIEMLLKFREFHNYTEGSPKRFDIVGTALRHSRQGDDSSLEFLCSPSVNGKTFELSSPHTVRIVLPNVDRTPSEFFTLIRNNQGTLRLTRQDLMDVIFDQTSDWAVKQQSNGVELAKGTLYTFKLTDTGWQVSAPFIQIDVSHLQDGLILERNEAQGIQVNLPDPLQIVPGFRLTVCNRVAPVIFKSSLAILRRIPEGLLFESPSNQLEISSNLAVIVQWDGVHWNIAPETTDDEFHRSVSGLNSYPTLARQVGLTWDIEFILSEAEVKSMPSAGVLRLSVQKSSGQAIVPHPFSVSCEWLPIGSEDRFIAFSPAPKDAGKVGSEMMPVSAGFMDLSVCAVNQVELDTTLREKIAQAETRKASERNRPTLDDKETLARQAFSRKSGGPEDATQFMSALVEAGIELSHPKWHLAHQQAVVSNNQLRNSSAAMVSKLRQSMGSIISNSNELLSQEILTRGCRFDVFNKAQSSWHSLCAQTVQISGHDIKSKLICEDEGVVTPGLTGLATSEQRDGTVKEVSRGSDVIFRWTGWGATLPQKMSKQKPNDSVATGGLGLVAKYIVEAGSQVKLRAGNTHQFRARLVDIAGNSWTMAEADEILKTGGVLKEYVSPDIQVARFQPSKSPKFYKISEKESEEVRKFVIRSYDKGSVSSAQYRAFSPKINFELMQLLGVLDGLETPQDQLREIQKAHDRGLQEEKIKFPDELTIAGKGKLLAKHIGFEDLQVSGIAWRFLPGREREVPYGKALNIVSLATGDHSIAKADPLISLYRREFLRSGVHFPINHINVILKSGKTRSSSVDKHELSVTLPPGESQSVVVSSSLEQSALDHFGLWNATQKMMLRANRMVMPSVRKAAIDGAASTLTPPVIVEFIHASQRPQRAPVLQSGGQERSGQIVPSVQRALGEKNATITFTYIAPVSSTARIDLVAEWDEPDDEPTRRRWSTNHTQVAIEHWAIPTPEQTFTRPMDVNEMKQVTHNLPDTRRRLVTYTAIGTSRYSEFFNRYVLQEDKSIRSTRGVQAPESDPCLKEEDFQLLSKPLTIDIPNSAEPQSFDIEYIVPMPSIKDNYQFGGNIQSVDETRLLRVYFKRPAFRSGFGELLGILVAPASKGSLRNVSSFEDEDADAVSEIAEDPLSFSMPVSKDESLLRQHFFPTPDEVAREVMRCPISTEQGARNALNGRTTTVLGYKIHEIEGEDLLYADVRIASTGRASPFLKLALVTYQPHSVAGAHVSNRPAFAWIRPSADRSVNVQFKTINSNPFSLSRRLFITVTGPAAISDVGEVASDMSIYLSRRKTTGRDGGIEVTKSVSLHKRWLEKNKFIAIWTFELEVQQFRMEVGDENEETIRGHCKAHIEETNSLIVGGGPVWFTDLGVGTIRWSMEPVLSEENR